MVHFSNLDGSGAEAEYAGHVRRTSRPAAGGSYARFVKRGLDLLVVLLAAPFVLPVILLLGLAIARDGGPAFYVQDRVGRGGRVFRIWKLRSMVVDAERRLEAHLAEDPAARAEWVTTQKLKNDPRITAVGRLIRKVSLDELPQLWNVFRGDMSLVGPRPMLPGQTALYPGRAYYALRPGLTGFWQISRRNETSFAGRAAYDTAYAGRISLLTDLLVLAATVRVVLRGTGY
jgi:lipopolysaccharide/colanic/teichoic acid biosynthesis glycosyltransferase